LGLECSGDLLEDETPPERIVVIDFLTPSRTPLPDSGGFKSSGLRSCRGGQWARQACQATRGAFGFHMKDPWYGAHGRVMDN
jgi:hypothetical protein